MIASSPSDAPRETTLYPVALDASRDDSAPSSHLDTIGGMRRPPTRELQTPARWAGKLSRARERRWLQQHNCHRCLDFSDREHTELQKYFCAMDSQGIGLVPVEHFEELLIGLGFVESREEARGFVAERLAASWTSPKENDGFIDFNQYLSLVRGGGGLETIFRAMMEGRLQAKALSFPAAVQVSRRRLLLSAIGAGDVEDRERGCRLMRNIQIDMPCSLATTVSTSSMASIWRQFCRDQDLVPDARKVGTSELPPSPRAVLKMCRPDYDTTTKNRSLTANPALV
eukprot:GEMP01035512.1.p1 GENE.GEMP01035512.1~~GEMP01035512.1.p1  ORF type:complete len:285 (+),score=41.77 GEMP01035512.1:244-1098(+)